MAKQGKHYVENQELVDELQKWVDSNPDIEKRVVSDRLATMFWTMATKYMGKRTMSGYPYEDREDWIVAAYAQCIRNLKNWKPEMRDSSFNYFTRAIACSTLNELKKYYRHKNLIDKMIELQDFYEQELNENIIEKINGIDD